jgi:hypothetical protein
MNFVVRFGLIALAVALLYYVVRQYQGGSAPVLNDGEVTMQVPDMQMPDFQSETPTEYPIAGSPEDISGSSVDKVNWDGLAENQLSGALSKQYQELSGDDLLPHNDHSNWADVYPDGVGQLQNKNFLNSGHHVGINTTGQHLRNANKQLRSEPANPQIQVSPWQQSSIGPDLLRRELSIGGCE